MNSFYDSWHAGTHKDVECVQCHIPPGVQNLVWAKMNGAGQALDDILNRTSTQPSADVKDSSCTRAGCHDLAKVRTLARHENPFFFEHAKHLDLDYMGIKMHCCTCHSHFKGDKHFEVNTGVCITCHLLKPNAPTPKLPIVVASEASAPLVQPAILNAPKAEAAGTPPKVPTNRCRNCHVPPSGPIQYRGLKVVHAEYLEYGAACESCHRSVTAAPNPIRDDRCLGCHDFGIERMTSVTDLHRVHSEGDHKVECFSCHGLIKHGPSAQTMRLEQIDCGACHKGQHQVQRETYASTGGGTPAHEASDASTVTPMFMAHVDCTGCHVRPRAVTGKAVAGATVAAATPEACDACHKPGLGAKMVPLWQKNTRTLYESVEKMLPPPSKPMPSPRAGQLIAEARQLLLLVRVDGSWGVHNPTYTQKLIEQARARIVEATELGMTSRADSATTASSP